MKIDVPLISFCILLLLVAAIFVEIIYLTVAFVVAWLS